MEGIWNSPIAHTHTILVSTNVERFVSLLLLRDHHFHHHYPLLLWWWDHHRFIRIMLSTERIATVLFFPMVTYSLFLIMDDVDDTDTDDVEDANDDGGGCIALVVVVSPPLPTNTQERLP